MPLRVDLVFSYWIFIWYLLYTLKLTNYNPKICHWFRIIRQHINAFSYVIVWYFYKTIVFFIIINIFIKVIPYYYLIKSIIKLRDVYATILLFLIFILWLQINNESLTGNIKLIYDSLLKEENNTPVINLLSKIEINYKKLEVL